MFMPHRCRTLVNRVSHHPPHQGEGGLVGLASRVLLLAKPCPGHRAGSQQGARAWPCHSMWRCSASVQDQADVQAASPFFLEHIVEKGSRFRESVSQELMSREDDVLFCQGCM